MFGGHKTVELGLIMDTMVPLTSMMTYLIDTVENNEDTDHDEVKYKHANRTIKVIDIATSNTLTKENAMMIIFTNTHFAIVTVIHITSHFNVTLVAVVGYNSFTVFTLRDDVFGSISSEM